MLDSRVRTVPELSLHFATNYPSQVNLIGQNNSDVHDGNQWIILWLSNIKELTNISVDTQIGQFL